MNVSPLSDYTDLFSRTCIGSLYTGTALQGQVVRFGEETGIHGYLNYWAVMKSRYTHECELETHAHMHARTHTCTHKHTHCSTYAGR